MGFWGFIAVCAGLFNPVAAHSKSFLLIGDSHLVGDMGRKLVSLIESSHPNDSLSIDASCGATPFSFFSEYKSICGTWQKLPSLPLIDTQKPYLAVNLRDALTLSQPDHIIVSLGTNLATQCRTKENKIIPCYSDSVVKEQIKQLLGFIQRRPLQCTWILAPAVKRIEGKSHISETRAIEVNTLISTLVSKTCTLVTSPQKHYPHPRGDGVHYFGNEAGIWAESVFKNL